MQEYRPGELDWESEVIFRTYLISSNQLKKYSSARLDPAIAKWYCATVLPKYVWVTEAVIQDQNGHSIVDSFKVVASSVMDATVSKPRVQTSLILHLPGLFIRDRATEYHWYNVPPEGVLLQSDSPYGALVNRDYIYSNTDTIEDARDTD